MKLSIFSILYLFVRIIPMIIFSYFIYQYLISFDINTLYFLMGLFATFIIVIMIGSTPMIQQYKSLGLITKVPEYCNTLLLTKNGPFSTIPLSQTMFSYMLAFVFYIIYKYGLIKQNIQYLVLFPLFIITDAVWNLQNNCINPSFILLAIVFGATFGLIFAYMIDKNKSIDLTKFQGLDRSMDNCRFNATTNKFVCYGAADTYDDLVKFMDARN